MSIQKPPDARDLRYLKLVLGRMYGKTDDEIAHELDDIASPQDLYERVREDGHPICPKCGATYVGKRHCVAQPTDTAGQHRSPKPRAQEFGELEQLPPAEEAIFLLRQPLDALIRSLERLRGRVDWLQSERYVVIKKDGGRNKTAGASWLPQKPLTQLIAVFALVEGADDLAMYKLLAKLHPSEPIPPQDDSIYKGAALPNPKKVDLEGLRKQTQDLRTAAGNIARIVRGGRVGRGRPATEVPARMYAGVRYAKGRSAEGASPEAIRQELNELMDRGPLSLNPDYTNEDVRWMLDNEFETGT